VRTAAVTSRRKGVNRRAWVASGRGGIANRSSWLEMAFRQLASLT
jgi:hypothetical protein